MATLTTSDRYYAVGTTEVLYLPALAASNLTPTRAEMTAGTILTGEIADISGWVKEAGSIGTPDLATRFVSNLPGRINVSASTLTFYADLEGTDVRATLPQDTEGWIMFCDGGDVAASKAEVFPVRVSSVGMVRSVGEQAGQVTVGFSITAEPQSVTIPALA